MDTFGINGDRKSDHNSLNQKDGQSNTIRIAYIPGIRNTEQFQTPELAHLGGAPQAFFVHENSNKHISVASSLSTGTLDEAIIMAVDKKATPKVFKLNSIKANNIDMIQRSNSLHSSNSIKRTQSQKRVRGNRRQHDRDDGRGNLEKIPNGPNPQDEEEDQQQQLQYTPAVVLTGPSARSSAQSTASDMTQKPKPPSMVLEPRPLHPNYHVSKPSSSPTSSKFEQTITTLTSAAITPNPFTNLTTESLLTTSSSSSPTLTALNSTLTSSTESKSSQVQADSKHSAEVLDSDEFRHAPWMHTDPTVPRLPHIRANSNSGSVTAGNPDVAGMNSPPQAPTTRNSTFSTQSARSGEEIMIFWDGHRHSRPSSASNL
ncbi:hypothetical protein EDD11_004574 [Mortierella claussenii]|nr:hypothetical protein EDD11_004574 [Mortierella claussenii]